MKYVNIPLLAVTNANKLKSFKDFLDILSDNEKDLPLMYQSKLKRMYSAEELDKYCSSPAGEKALQKILNLKQNIRNAKALDFLEHDLELFHLKHFVKNSKASPVRYTKSGAVVKRPENKNLFTVTDDSVSRLSLRAFASFLKESSVIPVELKQDRIKIYDDDDNEKILNISQLSFLSPKKKVLCCVLYKKASSIRESYNTANFYCLTVDDDFSKHCVVQSWPHGFSIVVSNLVQYVNSAKSYKNLIKSKNLIPKEFKTLQGIGSTLYRGWTISQKGIDSFVAGKPVVLKQREHSSWSPYEREALDFATPATKKEGGIITELPASKADVLINLMHPLLLPYAQEAEIILNGTGVNQLDKSNSRLVD